jgi:RNA polymerase sigma-70 factor (ECF subfamily)
MRRRSLKLVHDAAEAEPLLMRVPTPAPGPDRQTEGRELRDQVDAALADLTPLERAAFTLRHLEERTIEEICATLGQTPAATRHSIFRAVAKMRRVLAPLVRVHS